MAAWVTVMFLLFPACSNDDKSGKNAQKSRDSIPVMSTLGVETFISDSGIIKYKVIAEQWDIYDQMNPSFWAFEQGMYLEQFDEDFNQEATIVADTAYYYDQKKLWALRGNVHIENLKGEKFDTELLFWDQNTAKIYADKKIRIEQADYILTGYGFESNQQLTEYEILNTDGIIYVEDDTPSSTEPQEQQTDSI